MMDLLNELKGRKDRQLRARLEKEEITKVLKEIERDKAGALEKDKRRELERIAADRENLRYREENLMDEIRNLEEKQYENERIVQEHKQMLQNKVTNSEYLTKGMRQKEIELAKERGEQLAKLKHTKELLEMDRERIMNDLDAVKKGDLTSIRRNEASRWVANDIINKGSNLDFSKVNPSSSMKTRIINGEAKIRKLKEEKIKIEKEAFPFIDELDILEKQYEDKEYNKKARMIARDLNDRNIRPDIKADQLHFMRKQLENNGGNKNNDMDEDESDSGNDALAGGNRQIALQNNAGMTGIMPVGPLGPGMGFPPFAGGVPPFGPGGYPGVPPFGPGGMMPYGGLGGPFAPLNPLGIENNPNFNYLKSQIDKQEEDNKKLENDLLNNGKLS